MPLNKFEQAGAGQQWYSSEQNADIIEKLKPNAHVKTFVEN